MEKLLISVNEKMLWSTLNQLECLVLHITIWQVLSILVFHVDFAIHTMAIDNELEDEQKAARIQEVHQLCETFKKSKMNQKNIEIADHIPLSCEDQSIIDEIDSIEFFEKRNIVYKFWKSMFGHSYPTSWWVQFRTLTSRCFTVLMRDSRLTVARFIQTVVLSTLIGLVFIQLSFSQSVLSLLLFHVGNHQSNLCDLLCDDDRVLFSSIFRDSSLPL